MTRASFYSNTSSTSYLVLTMRFIPIISLLAFMTPSATASPSAISRLTPSAQLPGSTIQKGEGISNHLDASGSYRSSTTFLVKRAEDPAPPEIPTTLKEANRLLGDTRQSIPKLGLHTSPKYALDAETLSNMKQAYLRAHGVHQAIKAKVLRGEELTPPETHLNDMLTEVFRTSPLTAAKVKAL